MAAIVAGVLWIVGAPLRVLGALAGAGVAGVVALVRHQRRTGCAGWPPSSTRPPTSNGANDQANAGMFAIASGGWWGVGLGASRQKWGSLPEAHSDFIFAVIGEELGPVRQPGRAGAVLVLGYAGIRIATRSDDPFCRYAAGRGDRLVHGPGADQPGRRCSGCCRSPACRCRWSPTAARP